MNQPRRWLRLGLLAALVASLLPLNMSWGLTPVVSAQSPGASCGPRWSIVPETTPPDATGRLASVSALTSNLAWAVGSTSDADTGREITLALRWDGTAWTTTPTPNPGSWHTRLSRVTTLGTQLAWALGSGDYPYLLRWDGSTWEEVGLPDPEWIPVDIDGTGPNDLWLVGSSGEYLPETLVAHWDGTTWTRIPSPNVPMPDLTDVYDSRFLAVEALAPNDVWAVGDYSDGIHRMMLVTHWDGTEWKIVPTPGGPQGQGSLTAISAASANDVWAIGSRDQEQTLFSLHWDGVRWTSFPIAQPSPWGSATLSSVAAVGPDNAWIVGSWQNAAMGISTLALQWDGTGWRQVKSPDAPGAGTGWNGLRDVAALSAGELLAVGVGQAAFGDPEVPLVERYADSCPPGTPALASLTIAPSRALGGEQVEGRIVLTTPAPDGGATVTLAANKPAIVSVPPTVVVPAGARVATFLVTALPVPQDDAAVISATWNDSVQEAILNFDRVLLTDVQLNPPNVVGGMSAEATVTLNGPAPAGGYRLELVNTHEETVSSPLTVTVPAGERSYRFPVTTTTVADLQEVAFSATDGWTTKTDFFRVSPRHSVLEVSPWMDIVYGGHATTYSVTLTAPAPAGGAVVVLSTNQPTMVKLPTTVTVPAGALSAPFTVETEPGEPPTQYQANVRASWGGTTGSGLLHVWPLEAAGIEVSPATVQGGSPSEGRVTLVAPALPGGTPIFLGSTSDIASVPISVTVPAGERSVTFPITTQVVSETDTAGIYVIAEGSGNVGALLTVIPDLTPTVTFGTSQLPGGSQLQGAVSLSNPAPEGGATINLVNSYPTLTGVPKRVIVPAGQRTATFMVSTAPVETRLEDTLYVSYGEVTNSRRISVVPGGTCPDFNDDGTITAQDVQTISTHWGRTTTSPGWDETFDLDGNGRISIVDLMQVSTRWGQPCS